MNKMILEALRNYGYRFLGFDFGGAVFGKPVGYGILRAISKKDGARDSLEISLVVKGNERADGQKPNLLWQEEKRLLPTVSVDSEYYLNASHIIAECEACIFRSPLDFSANSMVRYDFIENKLGLASLLNDDN